MTCYQGKERLQVYINEGMVLVCMVTLAMIESRCIYYKKSMTCFLEHLDELVGEICPNSRRALNDYENIFEEASLIS